MRDLVTVMVSTTINESQYNQDKTSYLDVQDIYMQRSLVGVVQQLVIV